MINSAKTTLLFGLASEDDSCPFNSEHDANDFILNKCPRAGICKICSCKKARHLDLLSILYSPFAILAISVAFYRLIQIPQA